MSVWLALHNKHTYLLRLFPRFPCFSLLFCAAVPRFKPFVSGEITRVITDMKTLCASGAGLAKEYYVD